MDKELQELYSILKQIGEKKFTPENTERSKRIQEKIAEMKTEIRRQKQTKNI